MRIFKAKEITICIHGFGLRRHLEFEQTKNYLQANKHHVVVFDMYEAFNDYNYLNWINKASEIVEEYINKNYKVNLIGFSMGGVISSYLASKYPINKLILLAPAFDYFDAENASRLIKQLVEFNNNERITYLETRVPDKEYFVSFVKLVKEYRESIKKVSCPLLILQGTKDEYVPIKASRYAYNEAKSHIKHCLYIEGATHELQSFECKDEVNHLINLFLKNIL